MSELSRVKISLILTVKLLAYRGNSLQQLELTKSGDKILPLETLFAPICRLAMRGYESPMFANSYTRVNDLKYM